jgi:nucleoside-diphosphate-sugar epimerase
MKVLVTAPESAIGKELIGLLLTEGFSIRALCRQEDCAALEQAGVEVVAGDLLDEEQTHFAMSDIGAVFNCSTSIEFDRKRARRAALVNTEGTRNLLVSMARQGAGQLVHVGSALAFPPESGAAPPPAAASVRAASDLVMRYARDSKVKAFIANPALVFGRHDRDGLGSRVIMRALSWKGPPPGGGVSAVSAGDVASIALKMLGRGRSGEVRTIAPYDVSHADLFELVRSVTGGSEGFEIPRPRRTSGLDSFLSGDFYYAAEAAPDDLGVPWSPLAGTVEEACLAVKETPGETL